MHKNVVIIAAGGKGTRTGANIPKQYQLLNEKPVLMHTIEAFAGLVEDIVVVIDPTMRALWEELCLEHQFMTKHVLVGGGNTRFESVKNGLLHIRNTCPDDLVDNLSIAVHDAARPLVDHVLIKKSFELAQSGMGNVLGLRSSSSVRIGNEEVSSGVDRNNVWLIQTPQTFPARILFDAFEQDEQTAFTDEASVVEKLGYNITIVESDYRNIKITYPEDFVIAQALTKN